MFHNPEISSPFFLAAPGGTGKTFLINLILAKIRSEKRIAIAVASSGIAATLLDGGRTAHATFKLPLDLNRGQVSCNISRSSNTGKMLKECSIVIWDESTMSHKNAFEAVSDVLKDLRGDNRPFGGVTMLFSGDFRQTLPVVPRGTRANEVEACINRSPLWSKVKKLTLSINMRVQLKKDNKAKEFSDVLLQIGDGKIREFEGKINIPKELCNVVDSAESLIKKIYPEIKNVATKHYSWFQERAILAPTNYIAAQINEDLQNKFDGAEMTYKSVDSMPNPEDAVTYPVEFLNDLNPSGMPPHILTLKVGSPVMLLRNMKPPKLCNGTRLQVKALHKNVLDCTIITGRGEGESVYIPRFPLLSSNEWIEFRRLQFPVKVCFAMTINKAQGQTLKTTGVDLRQDCFSHGQFYVACSRVSAAKDLTILNPERRTANVVYKEVLRK